MENCDFSNSYAIFVTRLCLLFNACSYKENDSSQETESDEIVEGGEVWNGDEDDGSEAIEKIMDVRVRIFLLFDIVSNHIRDVGCWSPSCK